MSFNLLAIVLAAVSSMIVGTVWYQHAVFGARWQAITGIDPTKPTKPGLVYPLSFLAALVTAVTLSAVSSIASAALGGNDLAMTLAVAGALWLGFTAATTAVHYLFEGRSIVLYAINAGHQLATAVVMGAIIGAFGY